MSAPSATALVLVLLAGARPEAQERLAVIAFGECDDLLLAQAARGLRRELSRAKASVLDEGATAAPAGGIPASLAEVRKLLQEAKANFLNLAVGDAERELREALPLIDRLPLGPQRWEAYWEARAWLARVLLHQGDARGAELLQQILQVDEAFTLPQIDFPPSTREQLALARGRLAGQPRHTLAVATRSGPGEVYLNGFAVGPTPFERKLLAGEYEVVVVDRARRSFARRLRLSSDASVTADLEGESPFVASAGPCFRVDFQRRSRLAAVPPLAGQLGVSGVVGVGLERRDGQAFLALSLDDGQGKELREGRLPIENGRLPALAPAARYLLTGEGLPQPAPAASVPQAALAPSAPEPPPPPPGGPSSPGWMRPATWALAGAALILGGAALYEHLQVLELTSERDGLLLPDGAYASSEARGRGEAIRATELPRAESLRTGFAIGAAAAAVGGGALLIWSATTGPEGSAVSVALAGRF